MRKDSGINGDAQRIEQMVWIIFLKVYDAQEMMWEDADPNYQSIIPEDLRWRNWAVHKDFEGKEIKDVKTDELLLKFVNNTLFPVLRGQDSDDKKYKGVRVTTNTPMHKTIVREVFQEVNQYMKNGVLLRQMINAIDDIDLLDTDDSHAFGAIYEKILKDLQSAGNAGEFYTPRAVTDFMIGRLNPQLGETVGDFAMGTGGFLISALEHMRKQCVKPEDYHLWQQSIVGQEWKPFPYLLAVTNVLLHEIKDPQLYHMDSLSSSMSDYEEKGKVNVIAMNPPYGGATSNSTKKNFKQEFRSSETADLFMVLIMQRLAENGRAGVVVPDGFLFGTDGAKRAIKEQLLRRFRLHTIIRLPGSVFAPYTSIATNILFFDNNADDDAPEGFCTARTWFYRLDMPEGMLHFNKSQSIRLEHFNPVCEWWDNRKELDESEKARCIRVEELMQNGCSFDQCKFPKEEEEVLRPEELLKKYHEERSALDAKIDAQLREIESILGIKIDA